MNKEIELSLACAMSNHDICKINTKDVKDVDVIVSIIRI